MYEVSGYELKKFFNTSGVKYRELGLKDIVKTESDEKLLDILSSDGMLIKRPIAYDGKNVVIGFKVDEWKESYYNLINIKNKEVISLRDSFFYF